MCANYWYPELFCSYSSISHYSTYHVKNIGQRPISLSNKIHLLSLTALRNDTPNHRGRYPLQFVQISLRNFWPDNERTSEAIRFHSKNPFETDVFSKYKFTDCIYR
uniref:Uncharacterized protein n=1 Tax=Rhizophagus irregularis (strain DAOM 181602 / DAOM 197198 / MUCL 43194) TaxID=747089 RepID=U9SU21_RHIID